MYENLVPLTTCLQQPVVGMISAFIMLLIIGIATAGVIGAVEFWQEAS
jgi:hypothetical protein